MADQPVIQARVQVSPEDKSDEPIQVKVDPICEVVCNKLIDEVVKEYNERLKPTTPLDPDWVRAQMLTETDAATQARKYDPLQIANKGDYALSVLSKGDDHSDLITTPELRQALSTKKHTPRRGGAWDYSALKEEERISADLSLKGGIAWLFHKAAIYDLRTIESGDVLECKVKKGDTLESIAKDNGTTIATLRKYSQTKTAALSIGQTLNYKKAVIEWYISGWKDWELTISRYNANPQVPYLERVKKKLQAVKEADCPCKKKE